MPEEENTSKIRSRDYNFFKPNSAEQEFLNAHKYKKNQGIQRFSGSDKPVMPFSSS